MKTEVAILAGGCFWGMQDLIRKIDGVISTEVGYTGGDNINPTYRNHPGHAEALKIEFDPKIIDYKKLLQYFFQIHNPTTLNRQGNDTGSSYRSAIFYTTETQLKEANELIKKMNDSKIWPSLIVTEVKEMQDFWIAEPEHQDYLMHKKNGYTCHYPRPDWILPE